MPGLVQCYRELQLPRCGCRQDECEDAAAADPARGVFAVADGAGESFHPAPWAQLLVEEFVATGMDPCWEERLPGLQKRWAQGALPAGEGSASLPWYQEAQFHDGAFATFLGMDLQARGSRCRWQVLAVGDTCLFHVRDNRLLEAFPVAQAADFSHTPWLVGSRTAPARIDRRHGEGRPGDRFWLMTDALAAWFLQRMEAGDRPWEWLNALEQRPDVQGGFREWITDLRRERRLRDDDVTLLSISL